MRKKATYSPKILDAGSNKRTLKFEKSTVHFLFDERILSVLNDAKHRFFAQFLNEAGFSYNTLKLHIARLIAEGFVTKEKTRSALCGRPKFLRLPSEALAKKAFT